MLPLSFYNHPSPDLAQALLGVTLVRATPDGLRAGIIVETEAYLGPEDRAAHTFGGRKTARVASMWKAPGTLYVYFTYGMHHCMNVVSGPLNSGQAVLIRALAPVQGLPLMRQARPRITNDNQLASGPAKACQALGIDRTLDGVDLLTSNVVWLEKTPDALRLPLNQYPIKAAPRIGIDYAQDWRDKPLRFAFAGHPCLSRPIVD